MAPHCTGWTIFDCRYSEIYLTPFVLAICTSKKCMQSTHDENVRTYRVDARWNNVTDWMKRIEWLTNKIDRFIWLELSTSGNQSYHKQININKILTRDSKANWNYWRSRGTDDPPLNQHCLHQIHIIGKYFHSNECFV